MKNVFIASILLIGCSRFLNAQGLKLENEETTYTVNNDQYISVILKIKNTSGERYVLWFKNDSTQQSDTNITIKNYFFKRKGDLSLLELANENLVTGLPSSIIFFTFLKEISDSTCFVINFIYKINKGSTDSNIKFLRKKINKILSQNVVLIRQKQLQEYVHLNNLKKLYFHGDYISLVFPSDVARVSRTIKTLKPGTTGL